MTKNTTIDQYPVKVEILSDGQPDPLYQISTKTTNKNILKLYDQSHWLFKKTMSYILASDPDGKTFDSVVGESPDESKMDSGTSKNYNVESRSIRFIYSSHPGTLVNPVHPILLAATTRKTYYIQSGYEVNY